MKRVDQPGRKCWECGWPGPGVELSCVQAPQGQVFVEIVRSQVFPFICIGCLGTTVAEWPGPIDVRLLRLWLASRKA